MKSKYLDINKYVKVMDAKALSMRGKIDNRYVYIGGKLLKIDGKKMGGLNNWFTRDEEIRRMIAAPVNFMGTL